MRRLRAADHMDLLSVGVAVVREDGDVHAVCLAHGGDVVDGQRRAQEDIGRVGEAGAGIEAERHRRAGAVAGRIGLDRLDGRARLRRRQIAEVDIAVGRAVEVVAARLLADAHATVARRQAGTRDAGPCAIDDVHGGRVGRFELEGDEAADRRAGDGQRHAARRHGVGASRVQPHQVVTAGQRHAGVVSVGIGDVDQVARISGTSRSQG